MANFVNNATLTASLSQWVSDRKTAIEKDTPAPPIPDYVAECALLMAQKLSSKAGFVSYTFKDDMIGEGVLCVMKYCHNFDPEKSQNAFAYVTQVLHNAFIRYITNEKKQTYTKALIVADNPKLFSHLQETGTDIIESYERRLENKRQVTAARNKRKEAA